ncbi:Estrone sulfotransferase [Fasciola hepatica]|uniref:Estrone sulfotransferase n=1 Tax=Fasciola hepatica TaxID=6192 RepID=A0A2H1BTZ4_FASHE|nr:Estrone sulfotransferase [Fasciola hepatica]
MSKRLPKIHRLPKLIYIPAGIVCFCTGAYLWKSRYQNKRNLPKIKDPEFTGLRFIETQAPGSLENDSPKWYLTEDVLKAAEEARIHLTEHLHPNDIFVASFPKSGTTWISEVVYLLVTKLNYEDALRRNLEERVPFMEYVWPGVKTIAKSAPPRIIKTHLPFSFLPEEVQNGNVARTIYIVRDPRDVVVSFYHFLRCFTPAGYKNKEKVTGFVHRFMEDRLIYCPWDKHVQSYLYPATDLTVSGMKEKSVSFRPKVLLIRYEALKADPTAVVRQIESFILNTWTDGIGANKKPARLTDAQLKALVEHCSFSQMAKNPMTNFTWFKENGLWSCDESTGFMRRGIVGDHKSLLSEDEADSLVSKAKKSGLEWTLREIS